MIKNSIKIAWRNILKNKAVSLINITGLSLGMAAAVLILLWVQNELSFDNYHPHADRIYEVTMGRVGDEHVFGGTPDLLAEAVQKEVPGVEKTASLILTNSFSGRTLDIGGNYFKEKGLAFVDNEWFNMFHYSFINGSAAAFNLQPNSIVLTESLAKKYYSDKNPVGQIIRVDTIDYQVRAVVKDNPVNSSFRYSIFLSSGSLKTGAGSKQAWLKFNARTFLLAKKDADIKKIGAGISNIFQHQTQLQTILTSSEKKDTLEARMTALTKMHLNDASSVSSRSYGGAKTTVAVFSILGLLLLVIASINYVNLSTARASKRSKEVSIKKILGAGTGSLFYQFMVESVLTSLVALFLTLVIVRLSLPWFKRITEKEFTLPLNALTLWEIFFSVLSTTVLLTGIYPALLLSSFKPLNVLRGMNIIKFKNTGLRKLLVTGQFVIAVSLSICTVVILKQLYFIQNSNDGYNRSQIFSFSIPGTFSTTNMVSDKTSLIKLLKNELMAASAIENTTVSNDDIQQIKMSMSGIADWEGKKKEDQPNITLLSVDPDFRKIFNLQLKEGRWYNNDSEDQHNYILSETTVAELNLKKPYIGQYFAVMQDTGKIIGIVKDFHFQSFHQKISAAVLVNRSDMKGTLFVQAAPARITVALAKAESTFKKFFPQTPFEYNFMDADFEKMYRSDRKTASLVTIFSGIAIFISCLGLFGLISFVAEQRTKEIGIRKILGASVANITTLLSKDFLTLVLIAIVVASPLAWWAMHKWLEGFAYRIRISWWMFAIAGISAILIALITVSIQAIRAAVANPAKSLRTE